ncbi:hypothetical protein [Embleya sp. AB8]|uniref:hypothetical protein n=1 Tax=Embleya sp. AB8 TaxID=3156304 RepID=UPI003C796933
MPTIQVPCAVGRPQVRPDAVLAAQAANRHRTASGATGAEVGRAARTATPTRHATRSSLHPTGLEHWLGITTRADKPATDHYQAALRVATIFRWLKP